MSATAPAHPSDHLLHAYGLGKLGDGAAATVDSHLESCPECRRRVAEMSGDSFLGRLRVGVQADAPSSGADATEGEWRTDPPERAGGTLPPELADQYELVRELGRGGMGVVWLARNKLLDRPEALKVLNKETLERRGTLDRFLREIRAVARLNHENVVRAYSALQLGDALVFVLEYVDGMDLARLVKQRGPLPVQHACYFAHQAALGLQHAHERGMVHRDIKPGNLILQRQGQRAVVKVLDFGLAKALSEQSVDGSLTREGQMLGTPDYIAPEQTLDAQKADIRADIYSLGCTLYYLLAGVPPFQGTSLYDILQAHHSMDARPLNLLRPEVPVELAAAVGKMLAKNPAHRFQTPAEVARALVPFFKKTAEPATVAEPADPIGGRPGSVSSPQQQSTVAEPETEWRSLIAFEAAEQASDPVSAAAPQPRAIGWRRRGLLVATAAGFGAVLLGVVVYFSIRKDKGRIEISAAAHVTSEPKTAPASAPIATPAPAARRGGPCQIGAGDWSVEGDELRQTRGRSNGAHGSDWYYVTFGDPDWSAYNFTFEANRNGGPDAFGALFHWLGRDHNRCFNNGGYGGVGSELRDHYPKKDKKNAGPPDWWQRKEHLYRKRHSDLNRWYRVRVEVRDVTVRCYLDDELLFEDTDSRYSHGRVGLASWATPARFRRVKVTSPAGAVLWDGLPDLAADGLQPGSVWATDTEPARTLTVLERDGDRLKGRFHGPGGIQDASGTIRDGRLTVSAGDVVAVDGPSDACDMEATLRGEELFVSWTGKRPGESGTYTLRLRKDRPPTVDHPASVGRSEPVTRPPAVPTDAKTFAGTRYRVYSDELAWHDARARCEALGGRLAMVKGAAENRFVAALVRDAGLEHAWLGATDVVTEGRWVWVDGTLVGYNAWDRGQPNNHSPEDSEEHYAALIASREVWWDQPDRAQVGWHPGFVCQWDDAPAQTPRKEAADGFVSLFNGKDLTGWMTHPAGKGKWSVENGAVVGRGPGESHLFTVRTDYTDFHARIEAKINAEGNSGLCFRTEFFGTGRLQGHGYEANIDCTHPSWRTGSLMHLGPPGQFTALLVKPDEWFTMDVVAVGKRVVISVNGQTTVDFVDPAGTYRKGRLALQQLNPKAVASFRRVEVKELSRETEEMRGDYATLFTAKDPVGWEGLLPYWRWSDGSLYSAPAANAPAHTFLCSRRKFRDFELRFRARRLNGLGNSGVQFRSTLTDRQAYRVRGPQCEISNAADPLAPPGSMVMEGEKSPWIVAPREAVARVYQDTEYNDFLIRCVGRHVTIRVNGVTTVDADYPALPGEGIIAWQSHGRNPATIEFRDVVLLDLSAPERNRPR